MQGVGSHRASSCVSMPRVRVRAVVFDLFVTLTDFDAERRRPELEAHLAGALGVDPVAFRPLMRETFPDRVTGGLGDSRSTLSALALRLGRDLAPEALDEVVALRPTALVVCGRLTAAVRAHARAWLVLYPDGEDRAVVGVEGHERAIAHPELADVLAAADAALEVLDRPAA